MARLTTHNQAGSAASAAGTHTRSKPGSREPQGVAPSWPSLDRAPSPRTAARRKTKSRNPDCTTDKHPHRRLTREWLRQGLTWHEAANLVRTSGQADEAVAIRALDVYGKMATVSLGEPITAGFPITAGDRLQSVRGSNVLAAIEE